MAGGVGSMVVVVVVPHGDGVAALLLLGVVARVEALLGQDAVVALDLAVVSWGVGADPLVAGGQGGNGCGEGPGPVVRPVVGNNPHEPGDAVGGEEGPGTAEEADRGGGLLTRRGPRCRPGGRSRRWRCAGRCSRSWLLCLVWRLWLWGFLARGPVSLPQVGCVRPS